MNTPKWFFDAPGYLKDFKDPGRWHVAMEEEAAGIVVLLLTTLLERDITEEDIREHASSLAYVNPIWEDLKSAGETVPINAWPAFPRAVIRRGPWNEFPHSDSDPTGIYRAVEHRGEEDLGGGELFDSNGKKLSLPVRDRQDEYVEWHPTHDSAGNITKLEFVAEGYDYFARLFEADEEHVVEIYNDFLGTSDVTADSLRAQDDIIVRYSDGRTQRIAKRGGFNPRNRHNAHEGLVHLSHKANSLGAEVNLAGVSGIARTIASGKLLDGADAEKLLCCNGGGDPNRNSDPLISQQAYAQVLGGYRYTLANPVGLYIAGVEQEGLLLPDNKTPVPREWWKVVRGSDLWEVAKSRVLRLELSVPKAEKITVSDLLIGGEKVKHAGQIAELLSVHLFVTRWKRPEGSFGPSVKCEATCCIKNGTERLKLVPQSSWCTNGWTLKFPDLLGGAPAQPKLATFLAEKAGKLVR